MDMGYIDPSYQSEDYFDFYSENMLGLAPYLSDLGDEILDRSFLLKFTTTGTQVGMDLKESYTMNCGEFFAIGGTASEFSALSCSDGTAFQGDEQVVKNAVPDLGLDTAMWRVDPLFYANSDIMLKIENYVPPMREELDQQYLAVDTWNRGTLLPSFFYDYFIDTFMIKAYTCD